MKLTETECNKAQSALCRFADNHEDYDADEISKSLDVFAELIYEHFENSMEFKHFNMHRKSTLKKLNKDELIDYIHMIYHNWENCDWFLNNVVKQNSELLDEIKKLKRN